MKKLLFLVFGAMVGVVFGYSEIDSVSWTQEAVGRVNVSYRLTGERSFVSVADVLTNAVSVGSVPAAEFVGDVNGVVEPGLHAFTWNMGSESIIFSRNKGEVWSFKLKVTNPIRLADYMAVSLADGSTSFYASAAAVPGGVGDAKWKTTHLLMRRIPAANVTVRLGLGLGDYKSTSYSYLPSYEKTFDEDYYIAVYEMTQGQYGTLTGFYPSGCGQNSFSGCSGSHKAVHATDWQYHPVENVNLADAQAAAATLTTRITRDPATPFSFAVPTDDQWEYACRAGSSKDVYTNARRVSYNAANNAVYVNFQTMQAYYGGSNPAYHPNYSDHMPVGQKTANAWGLYDMLGNVEEWCLDTHDGKTCCTKGGGHGMSGENMTVACRQFTYRAATTRGREVGFRLVCNLRAE